MSSLSIREIVARLERVERVHSGCAVIHSYEIYRVGCEHESSKRDRPKVLARDKEQVSRRRVAYHIIEVLVGSIEGETERIHQGRPQYAVQLNRGILSAGNIVLIGHGTSGEVWEHVGIFIKAVSEEDPRFFADLMVYPGHKIIFVGSLEGRKNQPSRAVSEVDGRSLVKVYVRFHDGGHITLAVRLAGAQRTSSRLGVGGRHKGVCSCSHLA